MPDDEPGDEEQTPPSIYDAEPDIPDSAMASWESQAVQYPPYGPPGVSYFGGRVSADALVDCLLYRNDDGELVGILNRYPQDIPPHESAGSINVWVRPDHRRRGIATELFYECSLRWKMPPEGGHVTPTGLEFLKGITEKYSGTEVDYLKDGWEEWHANMEKKRSAGESLPTPQSVREPRKNSGS